MAGVRRAPALEHPDELAGRLGVREGGVETRRDEFGAPLTVLVDQEEVVVRLDLVVSELGEELEARNLFDGSGEPRHRPGDVEDDDELRVCLSVVGSDSACLQRCAQLLNAGRQTPTLRHGTWTGWLLGAALRWPDGDGSGDRGAEHQQRPMVAHSRACALHWASRDCAIIDRRPSGRLRT